jgi:hypothetical protein
VIVQEKVDGSCMAVACVGGEIISLQRRGYLARSSPFEMHHLFADWVERNERRFRQVLTDGERLCGEWLAQAHGTRYDLPHEPFVVFDLMRDHHRVTVAEIEQRTGGADFILPAVLSHGGPCSVDQARTYIQQSAHGAIDPVEGAVWRVEHRGAVDFLAKWVHPDKVDGAYLPEVGNTGAIWNWRPAEDVGR